VKIVVRQTLNIVALVLMLFVNMLVTAFRLNGATTAEISNRFPVYFVPAGYVFSVWGLIYLGLLGFAVYQALPSQRANVAVGRVGYLFIVTCAANIAWLLLWQYEYFAWTLPAMGVLLVALIVISLRLGRSTRNTADRWLVHIPFSLYLSWIAVATIADATVVLYHAGWSGWGISGAGWAVIMLVVAAALAIAVVTTRRDTAYGLVAVWALAGIAVKQALTPFVAYAAAAMASLVFAVVLVLWALRFARRPALA
jgi:hypothetical protein